MEREQDVPQEVQNGPKCLRVHDFGTSPPPHACRKELEGRPGMGGVKKDGGGGVKGRRRG